MLKIRISARNRIWLIAILISFILTLIAILSGDKGVLGNVIILSIFLVFAPQLIFNYIDYRTIKEIEEAYPNFLRDLVDSTKAGLPLHKAIIYVSVNSYGPLTKEVKKMANQLSWNVNVVKVLKQSQERLKSSPILVKAIRILIETYNSGGRIPEILDSLSTMLNMIQETKKERKALLQQYVTAMYIICIVFIGIIAAINKLMIPIFESASSGSSSLGQSIGFESSNPCSICIYGLTFECLPCKLYFNICQIFNVNKISISCYYFALFFSMSVIQAIFGGLIAGQISEGSTKAGIRHSLIMFAIVVAAFLMLIKFKIIGA